MLFSFVIAARPHWTINSSINCNTSLQSTAMRFVIAVFLNSERMAHDSHLTRAQPQTPIPCSVPDQGVLGPAPPPAIQTLRADNRVVPC